jgi:hypothetical protein
MYASTGSSARRECVVMLMTFLCNNRVAAEGQQQPFLYFKLKQDWIYVYSGATTTPAFKQVCPDVVSASVCVVSKHFNPEVYQQLAKILFEQYRVSGDPTKILEGANCGWLCTVY